MCQGQKPRAAAPIPTPPAASTCAEFFAPPPSAPSMQSLCGHTEAVAAVLDADDHPSPVPTKGSSCSAGPHRPDLDGAGAVQDQASRIGTVGGTLTLGRTPTNTTKERPTGSTPKPSSNPALLLLRYTKPSSATIPKHVIVEGRPQSHLDKPTHSLGLDPSAKAR